MSDGPTLSLFVLRVSDITRSLAFYSTIGIEFEREQHGSGPEHYAGFVGSTVFELYPSSDRYPVTSARLGFAVSSVEDVLGQLRQAGCKVVSEPTESTWGIRAVVDDPDGHRIELSQQSPPNKVPKDLHPITDADFIRLTAINDDEA